MISALSGDHEAPTGRARADQHLYAQFARDAYRKQGVPHYKLIAENRAGPTANMRAYRKRTGAGPVVIAFRGTQVEEAEGPRKFFKQTPSRTLELSENLRELRKSLRDVQMESWMYEQPRCVAR